MNKNNQTPSHKEVHLRHPDHDFDGIQELDNDLPRWWVGLFYLTIGFSVVYLTWYHMPFFPSQSLREEYEAEMAALEGNEAASGEQGTEGSQGSAKGVLVSLDELKGDASLIQLGKDVYTSNCASCHGGDGGGLVGPNLADNFWMHGNKVTEIAKVIEEGVPAKGMPAWGPVLGKEKIKTLVAYVASLQGTNPATPKPPQGQEGSIQ